MSSPSKVLKIHARKQRAQTTQQINAPLNFSGLFSGQQSTNPFQSSGGSWNQQQPGADSADVYERFDYLSKLKEENEVLVTLLKVRPVNYS